MNLEAATMRDTDNPRSVMLGIVGGTKLPPLLKLTACAFLNAASENDISKLRDMFVKSIGYIDAKDTEGLKQYLVSCGLSADMLTLILNYAATNTSKDE